MSTEMTFDRAALDEICERYGIEDLSVFGSVAKGVARDDSDIDLLYQFKTGTKVGWGIAGLQEELEALFGRPVDLVSRKYAHPLLRDEIIRSARQLYAA